MRCRSAYLERHLRIQPSVNAGRLRLGLHTSVYRKKEGATTPYRGCLHGEVQGIDKIPVFGEHEIDSANGNAQQNSDDSAKHKQPINKAIRTVHPEGRNN